MYKKKDCLNCGKKHQNKKFCCIKCAIKYNWKKKNSPYRTKDYSKKKSEEKREWYKTHKHPRGMLGKKQSEKALKSLSEMCKKRIGNKHPYWKGGSQVYWNNLACKVMKDEPDICFYKNDECKGKILVHHKNKDITNNSKHNLLKVCFHHHRTICHKDIIEKMRKMRWNK